MNPRTGKKVINTFGGGMNLDVDKSLLKKDQYRYAENIRCVSNDDATSGAITNIQSSSIVNLSFGKKEEIIATSSIRDIGVIFTVDTVTNKNRIYRVTFEDPLNPIAVNVLPGNPGRVSGLDVGIDMDLDQSSVISIVGRFEDFDNIKVYWADGKSYMRSINIAASNDLKNEIVDNVSLLDILPSTAFKKPSIYGIGTGLLNSGLIQYYYQLFNSSGSETAVSQPSPMIHLTESTIKQKSIEYLGAGLDVKYGKPANKSVKIEVGIPDDNKLSKIRLISAYYYDYAEIPLIRIVKELDLVESNSGSFIIIEDSGVGAIGELSVEEFASIGGYLFKPNYLESKDNILFAGNVKEDTWDMPNPGEIGYYDTRSYQFDANGDCHLKNGAITTSYPHASIHAIPHTHDSIHEEIYTVDKYSSLTDVYDKDGNLGGSGVNVDYLFTNTYFIESYGNFWSSTPGIDKPSGDANRFIDNRTARIGDIKRQIDSIRLFKSDGSYTDSSISNFGLPIHEGPLNYANPLLSNNFKSYQRDEVYRFAAVFYDSKGRSTTAKWIADIRFPAGYVYNSEWNSSIFEMPEETDNSGYIDDNMLKSQELLVKPIGLSFSFRNIPSSVSRIEIVRAKRDLINKTILAQGVVQKVGTYHDNIGASDYTPPIEGSIMPHPVIAMGYNYSALGPFYGNLENLNNDGIDLPWSDNSGCMVFGLPNRVLSARPGFEFCSFYEYNDFGNGVRPNYNFTKHVLSPYRSSPTDYLFINPETSFYGVDFTEQLRGVTTAPTLEMVDIIFPKSTPPTLLTARPDTGHDSYYGSPLHYKLSFYGGGKWNPSALYFGADINTKNRNNTSFLSTFGLFGINMAIINPAFSSRVADDLCINLPDSTKLDIYLPTKNDGLNNTTYPRGYIATGGLYRDNSSNIEAQYKNGADSSIDVADNNAGWPNHDKPIALKTKNVEGGLIGGTFKYFRRLFDVKSDSKEVRLLYQNSRSISDRTIESTNNPFSSDYTRRLFNVNSFEYSGDSLPKKQAGLIAPDRYVSNGGKQYLNLSFSLTIGDCRDFIDDKDEIDDVFVDSVLAVSATKPSGHHGEGIVFSVNNENTIPSTLSINTVRNEYSNSNYSAEHKIIDKAGMATMSTYVMNMKKLNSSIYGGASIVDRQFTEYISTGYSITPSESNSVDMFGGDTFIGIFDYTVTRSTEPMMGNPGFDSKHFTTEECLAAQAKHVGAMIPLESSINLHLVNSKSYVASNYNGDIEKLPGSYMPAGSYGGTYTSVQELPQYAYNSAYSAEPTALSYYPRLIGTESNKSFDCRVYSSEVKTNDELSDSWTKFKVANYIDVDSEFGRLTNLYKFNNKLFFWQDNSFGVLSVNERSLMKDNNLTELVLGTSGILTRFDYISTSNGFKYGIIGGIANSDKSLYWYDSDRAEMVVYGGSVESLSKLKGVQSLLNKSKASINSTGNNIPMIYDKKYNEIMISLYGIGDATSIE